MSQLAIRVEGLGKQYRIGEGRAKYETLREAISHGARRRIHTLRTLVSGEQKQPRETVTVWALREVSIDVGCGEVVGVIGRNGAGKSTLLKVLSRITEPTVGYAEVHGRVGSLLEVGTGFHPELTGRENIFLNGAILGMKKVEIEQRFDEIVAFSEIEKFIDTPVKHYSSGMYLRLAFAVAAHLEPEVLLVDEVLAVGDASFQKKCMGKMEDVAREGRTVLFVSHNMGAIRALCQRAVWLADGGVCADGEIDDVVHSYLTSLADASFHHQSAGCGLVIESVKLRNAAGEQTMQFTPGEDLVIEICFYAPTRIEKPYIVLAIQHLAGTCFTANMLLDGHRPEVLFGKGVLMCRFKSLPLLPNGYTVRMGIRGKDGRELIMKLQDVASFVVSGNLLDYGFQSGLHSVVERSTPVIIPYEWVLPDGQTVEVELTNQQPGSAGGVGSESSKTDTSGFCEERLGCEV